MEVAQGTCIIFSNRLIFNPVHTHSDYENHCKELRVPYSLYLPFRMFPQYKQEERIERTKGL